MKQILLASCSYILDRLVKMIYLKNVYPCEAYLNIIFPKVCIMMVALYNSIWATSKMVDLAVKISALMKEENLSFQKFNFLRTL